MQENPTLKMGEGVVWSILSFFSENISLSQIFCPRLSDNLMEEFR